MISQSAMDKNLIKAFKTAEYRIIDPNMEIFIGKINPDLDKLLLKHKSKTWAFITPFNPRSQIISKEKNELRFKTLQKKVNKYISFEGTGGGQDKKWPLEKSLLILNINLPKAIKMGRLFDQDAIVFGYLFKNAEVIIL